MYRTWREKAQKDAILQYNEYGSNLDRSFARRAHIAFEHPLEGFNLGTSDGI